MTIPQLVHIAIQSKEYSPTYAWQLTLEELISSLTPLDEQDKGSLQMNLAELMERAELLKNLSFTEQVELEQYIRKHTR